MFACPSCPFVSFLSDVSLDHAHHADHAAPDELSTPSEIATALMQRAPLDGFHIRNLATEPTGEWFMVGVYETQRSRKYVNLYVRDPHDGAPDRPWRMQLGPRHCVGWFSWAQIQTMLFDWLKDGKDVRWNSRISGLEPQV